MRIIILALCCVCGNYGENSTERRERSNSVVTFKVSVIDENARCIPSKKELNLEEGSTVILNASSPIHIRDGIDDHIAIIKCILNNGTGKYDLGEEYNRQEKNDDDWREEQIVKNHMFGTWTCTLKYNKRGQHGDIKPIEEDRTYSYVLCNITVKKPDVSTTIPVTPATPEMAMNNTKMWSIIGGVGTVVLLIIIGQAIALCYFRRKAQPRRMDDMKPRSRSERGDRARYSAPPCKKGKSSARTQADRDSHIYEMVGVNALYNKSSDLVPEANTAIAERTIRDRPPLPLPHEIPKPVLMSATETLPRQKATPITSMPSTSSLNSNSSGRNLISKKGKQPPPPGQGFKKAPARPPKQIDDSLPGSLRRPAMPLPAPTPSPAPAPASDKSGALPKTPSTESPMSELKNIFKKRNARKDTPTSSPAATLERKDPPKLQTKPSTLTKSPKKQPPDATTMPVPHTHTPAVKPINQSNQIKLILPKIEASLKAPKPLVPKPAIEPTTSPIKSPPTPMKKPSQIVSQKPMPLPVTQLAPIPVQKRPLPTPETSRKLPPEPISPQPMPPLPPIYQASHEGQSPNSDDDEEWTYEQLGEYNIYNI